MRKTIKAFLRKEWGVDGENVVYGSERYPLLEVKDVYLTNSPVPLGSTLGVGHIVMRNGKDLLIQFEYKARWDAISIIRYITSNIKTTSTLGDIAEYVVMSVTGSKLEIYQDYLILSHVNSTGSILNSLTSENGGKIINYSDITALQFKEPSNAMQGYLQISYAGYRESKIGVTGAINDENSILIDTDILEKVKEIYRVIEERRKCSKNSVANEPSSVADELLKFKQLLDCGAITMEEFNIKKQQLLGN